MKKQLMAGTALVAATMFIAGGAVAAEKKMMKPSISVNGYYEGVVGGILDEDSGADTSALDTRTDAEIHFNGRATLDDGMKIHARVELEGQNNHSAANAGGDPIDEYFVSVSGSFGKIILGGTGGAPVKMLTGLSGSWATGVGENLSFDDGWVQSMSDGPDCTTGFAALAAGHGRCGEDDLHLPEIRRLPGRPDLLAEPSPMTTATARNNAETGSPTTVSRGRSAMAASSAMWASASAPA